MPRIPRVRRLPPNISEDIDKPTMFFDHKGEPIRVIPKGHKSKKSWDRTVRRNRNRRVGWKYGSRNY